MLNDTYEFKVCPRCFIALPLNAVTDPVCRMCHVELKGAARG